MGGGRGWWWWVGAGVSAGVGVGGGWVGGRGGGGGGPAVSRLGLFAPRRRPGRRLGGDGRREFGGVGARREADAASVESPKVRHALQDQLDVRLL
jgi:hypothetical protein